LAKGEPWPILLCGIFGLMIVASLMYIIRQPRNPATFPFMVPGVPTIPALTIFFNVLRSAGDAESLGVHQIQRLDGSR